MTLQTHIKDLENQIQSKSKTRAKLIEAFNDSDGPMQSQHDHMRQDLSIEIGAVDQVIKNIQEVISQLKTLSPLGTEKVQPGHIVKIQIGDEKPELILLLNSTGGTTLGDMKTISISSPIGSAIVNQSVGTQLTVNGKLQAKILSIE